MRRLLVVICALGSVACSSAAPVATPTTSVDATTPATRDETPPSKDRTSAGSTVPSSAPTTDPTTGPGAEADRAVPTGPPEAGIYRYGQSGSMRAGVFSSEPDPEGTLEVRPASGRTQRQIRDYGDQSLERVLIFRDDAVLLSETVSRFGSQQTSCRFERPIVLVRLPLEPGSSWKDSGSCDALTLRLRARVLRETTRTVGGQPVDTMVVRYRVVVEGDGVSQTTDQDVWLSLEHRMVVRSEERSEGTFGSTPYTIERTERLLSLEPA